MSLYHCLIYLISHPMSWEDHISYSKTIMESNFELLQKYFPGESPTVIYVPLMSQSPQGIVYIKYTRSTPANLTFRLWGRKYTIESNEELAVPVPPQQQYLKFQIKSRKLKYPLSQLQTQCPLDLTPQSMPLQVQYLYRVPEIDLATACPDVNAENHRELLLRLALVTQEPPAELSWLVSEFERRYNISPISRVKTFLQIALETQMFLNAYTLRQLGIMLYNTEDKTTIASECQQLLERLKTHLIRFDFIYLPPHPESHQGAIGAIIFLIKLLTPESNEILVSCIREYVKWNYKAIKMNAEKGRPCDSKDVAVLAKTTQTITKTLIHFETEYRNEFGSCSNIHSILATQFYYRLRHDIKAFKIVLAKKTMILHDNLRVLHQYLINNKLIELNELLLLKDVFSLAVADYLLKVENKFHEFIPNMLKQDVFQPISSDCPYSHSLRMLFVLIGYNTEYVLKFKFCSQGHKLYLLSIIEGTLEEYMRSMVQTSIHNDSENPLPFSAYLEHNQLEPTVMLPMYVAIHNVINLKPKFISLINDFKQTAAVIDYNLNNLDERINQTLAVLVSYTATSIPIDFILQQYKENKPKLISTISSCICVIVSQDLPHHITMQLFNKLFIRIIHWLENQALNQSITLEDIQYLLPQFIDLFHVEGNGLSKETLLQQCSLLTELEQSSDIKWTLNEIQNHSVFVLQALKPKELSRISKSVHQLHYQGENRFSGLYACRYKGQEGYLFEMDNTVDFISNNRKKTIHLGEKMPEIKDGQIKTNVYAKSIKVVATLFSSNKPTPSQEKIHGPAQSSMPP